MNRRVLFEDRKDAAYNISICILAYIIMDNGFDIQTKCIHDQNRNKSNALQPGPYQNS